MADRVRLRMLPLKEYTGVNRHDPIRFYRLPIIGGLYRRRAEMCLAECRGGEQVLEVGFGSGVTFLNLHDWYTEIHGLDLTAQTEQVAAVFAAHQIDTDLRSGNVLHMPYGDEYFDTVLLISILEHLKPDQQRPAFQEIYRVLKPGGQVVHGVPVERPFMVFMFRLLRTDIRAEHFSTESDVAQAAMEVFKRVTLQQLRSFFGPVYEVGHFVKAAKEMPEVG